MNNNQEKEIAKNSSSEAEVERIRTNAVESIKANPDMTDAQKAEVIGTMDRSFLFQNQITEINKTEMESILSKEELEYFNDCTRKQVEAASQITKNEFMVRYSSIIGHQYGVIIGSLYTHLDKDPKSDIGKLLAQLWLNNFSQLCDNDEEMIKIRLKLVRNHHGLKALSLLIDNWQEKIEENKKTNEKLIAWLDEAISYHGIKPVFFKL